MLTITCSKDDAHSAQSYYSRVCKLLFDEVEEMRAITIKLDPETLEELDRLERREWAGTFKKVSCIH